MKTNRKIVDVSIVSANYNNGVYLKDYFESILNSSVLPAEVIFVDDGSTDDSVSIASQYESADYKLKIITLGENIGFANALNKGVEESSGKYIMRLDTDDFIDPDRIKLQYFFLENEQKVDLIGSNVHYFNDKLKKVVFKSRFPLLNKEINNAFKKGYNGISHPSIMARSQLFKSFKYEQSWFPAEEYNIFSRMVGERVIMQNLAQPLTFYRIHSKSISTRRFINSMVKTNDIRKTIFGLKTNSLILGFKVAHLFLYRKGLAAKYLVTRYFLFFLSILFYPAKLIKWFNYQYFIK